MSPREKAIVESIAREYGFPVDELLRHPREVAEARGHCARRLKAELGHSAARIARLFNLTDAAVRYYLRRHPNQTAAALPPV